MAADPNITDAEFAQFQRLIYKIAGIILGRHPAGKPFDVWSAASSTGEEIYTIAMVLAVRLGMKAPWTVTGSDISQSVLTVARRGLYWLDRTRGLPQEYLRKYCLKGVRDNEGSFLIAPELRQHKQIQPTIYQLP